MFNTIRPYLARLIASGVAALALWITNLTGLEVGTDVQGHMTEVGVFVALIIYSVVHKMISGATNPADVAKMSAEPVKAANERKI